MGCFGDMKEKQKCAAAQDRFAFILKVFLYMYIFNLKKSFKPTQIYIPIYMIFIKRNRHKETASTYFLSLQMEVTCSHCY